MNPTKLLREDLSKSKAEFARLEKLYGKLTNAHSELITSNIELDRTHEAMAEGLAKFCEGCSERGGALCQGCLLNKWLY